MNFLEFHFCISWNSIIVMRQNTMPGKIKNFFYNLVWISGTILQPTQNHIDRYILFWNRSRNFRHLATHQNENVVKRSKTWCKYQKLFFSTNNEQRKEWSVRERKVLVKYLIKSFHNYLYPYISHSINIG